MGQGAETAPMDPLQDSLPEDALAHPLPGTRPCAPGDWLRRDGAFEAQMALRDHLIQMRRAQVIAQRPEGAAAAQELLALVAAEVPDQRIPLGHDDPLADLGRLAQEDFAIMLPGVPEHWLAAAVICFPSRWRLDQKIGRPLTRIHAPVPDYDTPTASRVQRLFDGVRVGAPLVRWNRLPYWTPVLHNPQPEGGPRAPDGPRPYMRAERQVILRLPETRAVVFSIHTYLVRL